MGAAREWFGDLVGGLSSWAAGLWVRLRGGERHPSPEFVAEFVAADQRACEPFVAALTQCPQCGYMGESETYELGTCPRCGARLFCRLMDAEVFYALHVKPGMVLWHPDGHSDRDGGRILILATGGPDDEGMMTFGTPTGVVKIASDWPCREFTAADDDLMQLLLLLASGEDL